MALHSGIAFAQLHHRGHHCGAIAWQNPYAERLIGSIRRECLDHVIILSERHLRRVLSSYFQYHHDARTHLSLDKDCPRPRAIQLPFTGNNIVAFAEVGGLHHRYERRAA
jgi:putative transposase